MGSRVAVLISLLIVLSGLGQPLASSGELPAEDIFAPPTPTEGIVVINGEWNVSTTESFRNATIYLTGNLTVETAGTLEFVNTSLVMNISENGEFWIGVDGTFTMTDYDWDPMTQGDGSQIRSNDTNFGYVMYSFDGSFLEFNNSLIRDCGYSSLRNGLNVWTDNAVFDGMTFKENYCGLFVRMDGPEIRNCIFEDNRNGIDLYFCEPVIENNTISGSTSRGIYLYYSSPEVSDCLLQNNSIGIYLRNSEPDILTTTIEDSVSSGIYAYYSSPLIENCQLSNDLDLQTVTNSYPRLLNSSLSAQGD